MKTTLATGGFICYLLVGAFSVPSHAEVTLGDYPTVKNAEWFKSYLTGVGTGLSWANGELANSGQQRMYCQPGGISLNTYNYIQIFENYLEANNLVTKETKDFPIGLVLLKALQNAFPCQ